MLLYWSVVNTVGYFLQHAFSSPKHSDSEIYLGHIGNSTSLTFTTM